MHLTKGRRLRRNPPIAGTTHRLFWRSSRRPAELIWAVLAIATVELVCIAASAFGIAIVYEVAAKVLLYRIRYVAESLVVGLAQVGILLSADSFRTSTSRAAFLLFRAELVPSSQRSCC
jgi:hypothetical protein